MFCVKVVSVYNILVGYEGMVNNIDFQEIFIVVRFFESCLFFVILI